MDRPRQIRALRIAWTAGCGVLCVLLILSWVTTYKNRDGLVRAFGIAWSSQGGALSLVYPASIAADPNEEQVWESYQVPKVEPVPLEWTVDSFGFRFWGRWTLWIVEIPYAHLIVAFGALAFAPRLRPSFSLRTLLIATTLLAILLGLVVWAA